jgi:hypothetical protein
MVQGDAMNVQVGDTVEHNGRPFYVHGIYTASIVDGWYMDDPEYHQRVSVAVTELRPLPEVKS